MGFLDPFFNKVFGFMFAWDPLWAILLLSFIISLVIVIIYKWMTNQEEMKRLKTELNDYQKKMKTMKDAPEKLMGIQKKAMSVNMQYMGKSMKPTLITFIPILLIFGWMNGHFAYDALAPGQEFELIANMQKNIEGNVSITLPEGLEVVGASSQTIEDRQAKFRVKGSEGEYLATLSSNGEEVDKRILITKGKEYASVLETYKSDAFKNIQLGNESLKVFWKLSWIWVYIISAIGFSMGLRKVMKIY